MPDGNHDFYEISHFYNDQHIVHLMASTVTNVVIAFNTNT